MDLVRLNGDGESSEEVSSTEAGSRLPSFAFGAVDEAGNRTAPSQNETWLVS